MWHKIYSLRASTVISLATSQQRSQENIERATFFKRPSVWHWPLNRKSIAIIYSLEDNIIFKTISLNLTFDHVSWKSIGVIYSLGASTLPSFMFKGKSQKILSRQHLYKDHQFDLDLWPCDCLVYRPFKPKINWQEKQYAPFFHRGI